MHPMTTPARRERFERIAEEVFEPLLRYLRRRAPLHDAEDLLSEVMTTVWRRIDDAPADRALLWCYGIARRALANHRRGDRRRLRLVERLGSEPMPHHPDVAEAQPDPDLARALRSLPLADQEVLRLWAWEQLEPREIAVVLGLTPNAATLRLSRARKKLAEVLTRQDGEPAGHRRGKDPEEHPDD
jgi:RNA polymerase sigma-70 factor (ECF subfamily)